MHKTNKIGIIKLLARCFIIILISLVGKEAGAQTHDLDHKNDFYKSKEKFKYDTTVYKYYKKSSRQKIAATTLGILSVASIGAGTYIVIQHEPTGQSADIGIVPALLGLYSIGAITGVAGLLYQFSAKKNRNKTISLYEERYGIGIILNKKQLDNYVMRANLNTNGVGIVISF